MNAVEFIIKNYESRVNKLMSIYENNGPRACANASGDIFESLIDDAVNEIPNIKSIKNDYLTVECNGYKMNNVQVDRHIRDSRNNIIKSVIEAKTYLDSCYCKRAVLDFIEISESTEVSQETDFVIVTGQMTISTNTYNYYQAFCKKHTGKNFKLFILNQNKKRNSKKPLYKEKFSLDQKEVKLFYEYLTSL